MIDRNNYEIFFLDYLEGNLDESLVDEFIEFLQQNPDLKEELDSFKMVPILGEEIKFPEKRSLYKEKYDSAREFFFAASAMIDNELPEDEENKLLEFISKNPEKEKELQLLEKTVLTPDNSIHYQNKNKLYRSSKAVSLLFSYGRVAAIFILIFAISAILKQHVEVQAPDALIVKVSDVKESIPPAVQKKENNKEKTPVKSNTAKKAKPKGKKSIRETNKGRIENNKITFVERDNTNFPLMATKEASLVTTEPSQYLAGIGYMINTKMLAPTTQYQEQFLADKLKGKMGVSGFKFTQLTRAGLDLASNISKNKISYSTQEDGTVSNLAMETRLFGFSIPTKKRN